MGLLDKALKDAVGRGLQNALGKAVEGAVRPAADRLAGQAAKTVSNAAAGKLKEVTGAFDEANAAMTEANEAMAGVSQEQWDQAVSVLEGMAGNMMKDLRVCPACGEAVKGEGKFCPKCGAKLPELTVMEQALCPNCGKQNEPGAAFCVSCGAKLPGKELEEAAQRAKDAAVLEKFRSALPQFPLWNCGGSFYDFSELETGRFFFGASFSGNDAEARGAVESYRRALQEAGFRPAGKYPSQEHLYKMADGVCCHADTEHCFEGDADCPAVYFLLGDEPAGGMDYTPGEPKKKPGGLLGSLFG